MGESASSTHPGSDRMVFACSGAADVGEIADRAARMMNRGKAAQMYCLGGIGGRVPEALAATRAARKILVIDGCTFDCAMRCLQAAGFTEFAHLRITDLGMARDKTPPTVEKVAVVADRGKALLAG